MPDEQWYWCLKHQTVEPADSGCANDHRMGPYPSQEAARHWKERVEERNRAWEEDDERWKDGE